MSSESVADKLPSAKELEKDVAVATKKSLQSLRDLAAGGVGGVCAVLVGHPFDLVKVRLQTAEKGVYNGAMDVVRKTIAREGFFRVSCAQLKRSGMDIDGSRVCMPVCLRRWSASRQCVSDRCIN